MKAAREAGKKAQKRKQRQLQHQEREKKAKQKEREKQRLRHWWHRHAPCPTRRRITYARVNVCGVQMEGVGRDNHAMLRGYKNQRMPMLGDPKDGARTLRQQ